MIGIYKIISPTNRVYIGQSIDIEKRWKSYKANHNYHSQTRLKNSIDKYGIETHQFILLEECDISYLNDRERYYQDLYDVLGPRGLNCKLTTTESKSGKNSIESNIKRSITQKGKSTGPRPDVAERNKIVHAGKIISEHHKQILRSRKGMWKHSDETKNKIKMSNSGKFKTTEHKLNMANAWLTKKEIYCPYCTKFSKNASNMTRWHFDNCKNKP